MIRSWVKILPYFIIEHIVMKLNWEYYTLEDNYARGFEISKDMFLVKIISDKKKVKKK